MIFDILRQGIKLSLNIFELAFDDVLDSCAQLIYLVVLGTLALIDIQRISFDALLGIFQKAPFIKQKRSVLVIRCWRYSQEWVLLQRLDSFV